MILLKRSRILFPQTALRYYLSKKYLITKSKLHILQKGCSKKYTIKKLANKQTQSNKQPATILDEHSSFKLLLLGNCAILGILPFYPALNVGICILNASFIMSRLGLEIKNYLLLAHTDNTESKSSYRSFLQYNKLILRNSLILLLQAICAAQGYSYESIVVTIGWIAYAFHVKILPIGFLINYIPLILSLLAIYFGKDIKSFVLQEKSQKHSEISVQNAK